MKKFYDTEKKWEFCQRQFLEIDFNNNKMKCLMINKKFPSGDKFYREKRQASADKEKKGREEKDRRGK